MPKRWLVFDIGCIECGEGSEVVGTFDTESLALEAADVAAQRQKEDWHGEHHFKVYDLEAPGA